MLRAKYHDLKRGIDNLAYIKDTLEIEQKKKDAKQVLAEKYDYSKKTIVASDYQVWQLVSYSK